MGPGITGVHTVVFKHEGLMPVLLGTERSTDIFRAVHGAAALVIEAEDGGHHISAGAALQRGGDFLLIADGPSGGTGSGVECGGEHKPSRLLFSAVDR